jgi:1,2-diacylglycerol 3-beta-glucosyltransferase
MPVWMYVLTIICVVLSYMTMGIYYLWMYFMAFFPKVQYCEELEYKEDEMDIHFFVVIPCLNEEGVIVNTVRNTLDTKMKNLRIIVIDDDSEDETVARLTEAFGDEVFSVDSSTPFRPEFCNKKLTLIKRYKPDAQKGKGRSLNVAYWWIRNVAEHEGLKLSKCMMAITDADSFVNRRVFERTAVIMHTDPTVGMVQTRVRIGTFTRDRFLPLFQDIEFFTYINNMQNVCEYIGTVSAAGNGQFNRMSAIDPEEPWTDCLLEDFDFSLRLLLKGWRTRLLQEDRVFQQGVLTYGSFLRQRSRWSQGGLQCLTYWNEVKNSRYLSTYGKIYAIFFMILPIITLLAAFSQVISWFIFIYFLATKQSILFSLFALFPTWELVVVFALITLFVFTPGLMYAVMYYRDTKENLLVCILAGIFQPIYNLLQVPAVLIAVWRQMTGKTNWVKTEHHEEVGGRVKHR